MTLTIDGRSYAHGALALAVPDCDEIRALIANVPVGELHLAAFDEALHPRAHKGESGGGRFIKKLLSELKTGDTFEHPTLGRMERLPQGGSTRADGRLTVRSLTTGKRVHMHPTREVSIPAPKAAKVARVKRSTGASAFEKELKMRVGTPEAYHAAVTKMAGNRIVAINKIGSLMRGQLEHDPQHGLRLVTATHVLEKRYPDRPGAGWQTHAEGFPEDLQVEADKLSRTSVFKTSGSRGQHQVRTASAETRIRPLGHVPAGEEGQQYHRARMEHQRSQPFDPAEHQGVRLASAERGVANPATLNKSFMGKSPSTRPHKPGHVYRPAEGYFPGSENEPHVLRKNRYPNSSRFPSGNEVVASGTRSELEQRLAAMPASERTKHFIEPPPLTTVRFVSPIDGQVVERQLTPGELEKFNRLVEKPPEARVADARRAFSHRSAANESIRAVPLSQVEPGTPYFNQHAEAMGVRGVEKKGAIEVHEPQGYSRTTKARLRQGDEVVHVKAGAQQTLTPGPQVGHVHITYNGDGHGLMDNAGQIHASGLSNEEALRRLREMNAAYDKPAVAASGHGTTASEHMNEVFNWGGVPTKRGDIIREMQAQGHDQPTIDRHIQGLEQHAAVGGGGYPVADAGRLRGVEQAVHSQSQAEAEREAKYLREYQRRFGSASSRAINRSIRKLTRV